MCFPRQAAMVIFGIRLHRKRVFIVTLIGTFFFILVTLFRKINSLGSFESLPHVHYDDVQSFLTASKEANVKAILFDPLILEAWEKNAHLEFAEHCIFLCHSIGPLSFAIYDNDLRNLPNLLQRLNLLGFTFNQFFSADGKDSHLMFMRYGSPIHLTVLHWNSAAGYWRQFGLGGQPHHVAKIKEFITVDGWNAMSADRAYERFPIKEVSIDGQNLSVPSDIKSFTKDSKSSLFIPCDEKRALYFSARFPQVQSPETVQFEHVAWKLLAKAKTILDELEIPFWISSGTLLGFYRQCKFIPWSMDVDIGVFIEDYTPSMAPAFESRGLALIHKFGKPEDSFELSFKETTIKLDVFFFYTEGGFMWNGGTQARSGRKFKYVFPPFTLCWTEFLELKVRIPCQTEAYIKANYGDNWFTPAKHWDWKTSPNNVQENGKWPQEERDQVIVLKQLPGQ